MLFREKGLRLPAIISAGQNLTNFLGSLTFSGTNINWPLYTALENYYLTNLISFNAQVSAIEGTYATNNNFALGTWRYWDAAAPRVTAAATEVRWAPQPLDPPLGLGDMVPPAGLTNVAAVVTGQWPNHSLALMTDGTVVGWGYNWFGESTGVPTGADPYLGSGPVTLGGQPLSNVVAVAAGQIPQSGAQDRWHYLRVGRQRIRREHRRC